MRLIVPGEPVPKSRPRLGRGGRVFTPARTVAFERRVSICAANADIDILTGPVSVRIFISLPLTKSGHERKGRGDIDNYAKSVLDGLNKIAFIDDNQVKILYCERVIGSVAGWTAIEVESAGELQEAPNWC